MPSPAPDALERAARQGRRAGAQRLRHFRRAWLRRATGEGQDIVIDTELPVRYQEVYCLDTGDLMGVRYLEDGALRALEVAF